MKSSCAAAAPRPPPGGGSADPPPRCHPTLGQSDLRQLTGNPNSGRNRANIDANIELRSNISVQKLAQIGTEICLKSFILGVQVADTTV